MGLVTRDVSAVTGECLMVKRSLWAEHGWVRRVACGVALNDVDFCLRLLRRGLSQRLHTARGADVPRVGELRGRRHPAEDERLFLARWGPFSQGYDRYVGGPHPARSPRSTTPDRRARGAAAARSAREDLGSRQQRQRGGDDAVRVQPELTEQRSLRTMLDELIGQPHARRSAR